MTAILASVRNIEEAQIVLDASAVGVIDMKEPRNGALGALQLEHLSAIHQLVDGRCKTSATIGDLPPRPDLVIETIEQTRSTGVDYIKVGMFGSEYIEKCLPAISRLAPQAKLVGVLFADYFEHFAGPCELLKVAGFCGAMVDTADKNNGSVFDISNYDVLQQFVATAKHSDMLCGIAGSLKISDIEPAMALAPDYIGFRSALCEDGKREDRISPIAVNQVIERVGKYQPIKQKARL